jgi:hypothetical protein
VISSLIVQGGFFLTYDDIAFIRCADRLLLHVLQVYYKFNRLSMLREPLMLISGFFFLFVASIVYMHADLSISKTSASYLAKIQWEEVINLVSFTKFVFAIDYGT